MKRVPQRILRLATLLMGISATSVALAVATVEVTTTGSKQNDTTLQLFDSGGKQVSPDPTNRNRFSNLTAGTYTGRVMVGGSAVGEQSVIKVEDGVVNRLEVSSAGTVIPLPSVTPSPSVGSPPIVLSRFGFYVGGGLYNDKAPTIGVFPVTDNPILKGPSRIYTTTGDVLFDFLKDNVPSCSWNIGGMSGHRSTSAQVPVGVESGWIYHALATTGATGLSSDGGADANLETSIREFHVDVGLPSTLLKEDGNWKYWLDPMIGIQQTKTTYRGVISNFSLPSIMSTTNQQIRQTDLMGGARLRAQYGFPNQLWASAGVGIDVDYYWAYYNGMQNNVCPICSAATQNFDVATHDSWNRFTVGASASLTVGYPIGKNADVFLAGMYRYQRDSSLLVNKTTETDPAPHIGSSNREIGSIGLGLRIGF